MKYNSEILEWSKDIEHNIQGSWEVKIVRFVSKYGIVNVVDGIEEVVEGRRLCLSKVETASIKLQIEWENGFEVEILVSCDLARVVGDIVEEWTAESKVSVTWDAIGC